MQDRFGRAFDIGRRLGRQEHQVEVAERRHFATAGAAQPDQCQFTGERLLGYSLPAKHLSQVRGTKVLTKVEPGASFGFGFGFAYALSYNISTSVSLLERIAAGSKLYFSDGTTAKTKIQTSGMLNFGLGYRISPKTTVNITAGIGLTADTPNFALTVSVPLAF